MFTKRILEVNDARTLKPVKLTDGERVLLAGLLSDRTHELATVETPQNAVEAAECMAEIHAYILLKRRLWEGVEL